jgi:hypothetical protein
MKTTLKHISVLQAGKITGVLYACLGLIVIPFFLLASLAARAAGGGHSVMPFAALGVGFAIFLPVIYGVMGFIAGVVSSALYNLIAGWVGGFEFEFESASETSPKSM